MEWRKIVFVQKNKTKQKKKDSSHENCIKKINEAEFRMEKKFKGVKYEGWFEATKSGGWFYFSC